MTTDWEVRRLHIKERVAATEERLAQLRLRRSQLAVGEIPSARFRQLKRAHQRVLEAVEHAGAARLAAAGQLERSANAHDAAARAHDIAADRATNDVESIAHVHIAEAHRAAARSDRNLARTHRYKAGGIDDSR
ncbi:MAG: hypothetical protein JOZ00_22770 [Mycobacterium sp.]|uniref:hypothetical protein n=1 Tax=Mycobacterium sp. TaxID=1785 RepID=UPI001ED5A852|nr:hypothetical protein [Mycobacterium sp.]MBV8789487.1 hypothetical protein [Mycobacterium sp.]